MGAMTFPTFMALMPVAGAVLALTACASDPLPTLTPTPDYGAELIVATERDEIAAVVAPVIVDAAPMDARFLADEPVLIAVVNGVERAYALQNMAEHEVVNDTLDGIPIAVTW